MSKGDRILDVQHISMRFHTKGLCVRAVTDVSFPVDEGETIGIVGESGLSLIHISEPTRR